MRKLRALLVVAAFAVTSVVVLGSPAKAGCNDCPGNCSVDVTVLGKTITHIDCA